LVRGRYLSRSATHRQVTTVSPLLVELDAEAAAACMHCSQHALANGDRATALAPAQDAVHLEPPTPARLHHLARLLTAAGGHEEARARRSEAEALAITFSCPAAQA